MEISKTVFGAATLFVVLAIVAVFLAKGGNAPKLIQNISSAIAASIQAATKVGG